MDRDKDRHRWAANCMERVYSTSIKILQLASTSTFFKFKIFQLAVRHVVKIVELPLQELGAFPKLPVLNADLVRHVTAFSEAGPSTII